MTKFGCEQIFSDLVDCVGCFMTHVLVGVCPDMASPRIEGRGSSCNSIEIEARELRMPWSGEVHHIRGQIRRGWSMHMTIHGISVPGQEPHGCGAQQSSTKSEKH